MIVASTKGVRIHAKHGVPYRVVPYRSSGAFWAECVPVKRHMSARQPRQLVQHGISTDQYRMTSRASFGKIAWPFWAPGFRSQLSVGVMLVCSLIGKLAVANVTFSNIAANAVPA
jgi:hypothetical protein